MYRYKIFGDLLKEFSIDVEAESLQQAYDIARESEQHKWTELESDNSIQPYDYQELVVTNTVHEYRGKIVEL